MSTKEEEFDLVSFLEAMEELQKSQNEDGIWKMIMRPPVWFIFKWMTTFEDYKRFLKAHIWSTLRKKLFPRLLPWEKTQALIMRDDLMQLYSDYESVEVEWKKKEVEDVQE